MLHNITNAMVLQITAKYCIRGMGRQVFGTVTVFICCYFIGLPAGISMMFLTPLRSGGNQILNSLPQYRTIGQLLHFQMRL